MKKKEGKKNYNGKESTDRVKEITEDRVILKVYPNMTEVSIEKWAIAGLDDREIDEPKKEEK